LCIAAKPLDGFTVVAAIAADAAVLLLATSNITVTITTAVAVAADAAIGAADAADVGNNF
jgi:hypothetical protein